MLCNQCPRNCKIDRNKAIGFCSCPDTIYISKYMLHHWEEPIISGKENSNGSGAIFFSGCNLKCVYCQNYEISQNSIGKPYTKQEFIDLIKELENKGAININLVTPTHYVKQIIDALKTYKPKIPVVWNSSGYEKAEEIEKLKDLVDIYLVDLKYLDNDLAFSLSKAPNYSEMATNSILQMKKNQPKDIIVDDIMKKGVIVRHLVLPNYIENTFKCLDWIKNNLGTSQIISVMAQYTPNIKTENIKKLNRKLHPIEYKRVLNYMDKLGLNNGFVQELESANSCYTPDFSKVDDKI